MSPEKLESIEALAQATRSCFQEKYLWLPSYPLVDVAPTTFFVNSSVAPFLQRMLEGHPIPPTALVQQCLRVNFRGRALFIFSMFGIVAEFEQLPAVMSDLVEYLVTVFGFERDRLHYLSHPDFVELNAVAEARVGAGRGFFQRENTRRLSVHWRYGYDDRLVGEGVSILYRHPAGVCASPSCDPTICACNRFQELGNLVAVRSSSHGRRYLELGFGLEATLSGRELRGLFDNPPYREMLGRLSSHGFSQESARQLSRCAVAVLALFAQNVALASRGPGYVLKKLLRTMFHELVLREASLEQLPAHAVALFEGALALSCSAGDRARLVRAAEDYRGSIVSNAARLRRAILDRTSPTDPIDRAWASETFGIPGTLLERALRGEL